MRYQSTTGLNSDQIDELVDRIEEIECGRKSGHGRPVVVDLYGQVVIALVLLRQNLNQMAVADLFGISQPTVSRIYRTILPLLEQVSCLHAPDFAEAVHNRWSWSTARTFPQVTAVTAGTITPANGTGKG